jgi:hypothetical protein
MNRKPQHLANENAGLLVKQFPDATKRIKKVSIDYGADNKAWGKSFLNEVLTVLFICGGFSIAAVVILILMGLLKALGVKNL